MFSKETYVNRRNQLKEKVKSGLVLILGNNDSPFNYPDNTYHFRQDSTFLYFFGIDCQGFAGIIDIDNNNDYNINNNDYNINNNFYNNNYVNNDNNNYNNDIDNNNNYDIKFNKNR